MDFGRVVKHPTYTWNLWSNTKDLRIDTRMLWDVGPEKGRMVTLLQVIVLRYNIEKSLDIERKKFFRSFKLTSH